MLMKVEQKKGQRKKFFWDLSLPRRGGTREKGRKCLNYVFPPFFSQTRERRKREKGRNVLTRK